MTAVLSEPPDRIGPGDIRALVTENVPESAQIEFKESLSAKRSGDPWMRGDGRIGERARNEILEEVVAFANAYGGALVLGIAEDNANPPAAAAITPLPRCADLAERFRLAFRDCVEPQLPALTIAAIPTEGDSGVIVLRTGRSPHGPHRVRPTLKCTVRRDDRCESLSMREIQDMTLNLARGTERLERQFEERAEKFENEFDLLETPGDAFGIRVTAIPFGEDVRFESVYSGGNLIEGLQPPRTGIKRTRKDRSQPLRTISDRYSLSPKNWLPMLRGARAEARSIVSDRMQQCVYREIHCDGLLEYGFAANRADRADLGTTRKRDQLDQDFPVSMLGDVLIWADTVRQLAYAPGAEYAIHVEIKVTAIGINVGGYMDKPIGKFGYLQKRVGGFPLYSFSASDNVQNIVVLFERDFWNLLGKEIGEWQGTLEILRK